MTTDIKELVKRLRTEEWARVEREQTRKAAADALEALAGEVEQLSAALRASRADEAQLIRERDRLKAALDEMTADRDRLAGNLEMLDEALGDAS